MQCLDIQPLLPIPNILGIATYVLGIAAGIRLLRVFTAIGTLLCAVLELFAGWALSWLAVVGVAPIAVARRYAAKAE